LRLMGNNKEQKGFAVLHSPAAQIFATNPMEKVKAKANLRVEREKEKAPIHFSNTPKYL